MVQPNRSARCFTQNKLSEVGVKEGTEVGKIMD